MQATGELAMDFWNRAKSLRHEALGFLAYWTGLSHCFEIVTHPVGAIILMYHSVADDSFTEFIDPPNRLSPEIFDRQMFFLRKHRHVIPLSELARQLSEGITPPAGTVCITFDDGYLDNLTIAAPILHSYQLPATLFLATGYVESGDAQWADVLYWQFKHRTADHLYIAEREIGKFDLSSKSEKLSALRILHNELLEADRFSRSLLLTTIKNQLLPTGRMPRLTINWDELRALRDRHPLIDIGGHTCDHIDLSKHYGITAKSQITNCANDIERELGIKPTLFSFPYGRWCEITRNFVANSGWLLAVGDGDFHRISPTSDRYVIPRIDAPRTLTDLRFKTSGAYPGIFTLFGMN